MPSWNEKPVTAPTINVNLKPCDCDASRLPGRRGHFHGCASVPVLTPCPIPRSVTFEVVLEKQCQSCGAARPWPHQPECTTPDSLKPIKVSCSISGKTWEESEPTEAEHARSGGVMSETVQQMVRDRWALVKALVLGQRGGDYAGWCGSSLTPIREMFSQRDAVYAALAKLERADAAAREAHKEAFSALDAADVSYSTMTPVGSRAADMLSAYVERLVEQVGVLGVGP